MFCPFRTYFQSGVGQLHFGLKIRGYLGRNYKFRPAIVSQDLQWQRPTVLTDLVADFQSALQTCLTPFQSFTKKLLLPPLFSSNLVSLMTMS